MLVFPLRQGEPRRDFGPLVRHVFENVYLNGDTLRIDGGESLIAVVCGVGSGSQLIGFLGMRMPWGNS